MEKTSEEITELKPYEFTYKRHYGPNKNSWIDTNVPDGVSMDELASGNCEIPSAASSTPKTDAVSVLSPITPESKDRACCKSLTFDERNFKRKARDDSVFHRSDASFFYHLGLDDREKDTRVGYNRRKKVGNRTPKEATHNSSLRGPNEQGTREEQREWQKSKESESLHEKIWLFMTRMDDIIGERKFSEWGGSVMDSIMGAYLTQNVNDVLSSSAFMSLAAKFPKKGVKVSSNGETSSSKRSGTRISRRQINKNEHDAELMNALKDFHSRYHSERKMAESVDAVDWISVMKAKVGEIAETIQTRGMNKNLAERIKDCLNHLVETFGSTDMEWMRCASCDAAKKYLRGIHGLGPKSAECISLLTLLHQAFPIDTNAGRVAIRLGWVPTEQVPKVNKHSKKMNLLQEYLWALLSHLDHLTLYELHCHIITFAKVFCTERNPNCSECPMRAECQYFASGQASVMVGEMEDYGLAAPRIGSRAPRKASIPVLKKHKKNVTSSRTEHQVYVLPENHRVLAEQESRVFHNKGPYLLAVWNSDSLEKDGLIQEKDTVYGTLLISARAANRGMFPLNGTYFQENEVFADEESNKVPIKVQRASLVDLPCTTLYCGKSMSPVCKGMTSDEIGKCFKKEYVCFRGFHTKTREPMPLPERFHAQASKTGKSKNKKRNRK